MHWCDILFWWVGLVACILGGLVVVVLLFGLAINQIARRLKDANILIDFIFHMDEFKTYQNTVKKKSYSKPNMEEVSQADKIYDKLKELDDLDGCV